MKLIFALLLYSLLTPATFAAVPASKTTLSDRVPVPVKLLRDDPLLQTLVTLDVMEQPLGDVLTRLNPVLKLDLTAEQDVADQRITLHVTGQPVHVLMGQLLALLSHDPAHPHGYRWGSLDRAPGARRDYQLWRDAASVAEEEAARNYPRRQLAVMLRQMRDDARLPLPDPKEPQPTVWDIPYLKAFRGLTDDQVDGLVNGATVPLDPALFPDEIAEGNRRMKEGIARQREYTLSVGNPKLIPTTIALPAPEPMIQVTPVDQDMDESLPDQAGKFYLDLLGVVFSSRVLDTYNTPNDPDPILLSLPADTGPRVDISPFLSAKTTTPEQRGDLGFTLQALARTAHLNIYGESFLRTSTLHGGGPHPGLETLQGSVPRLVAQICALWDYHAQPVPGGYLFWSRTWAQDRARDIPERQIASWRRRLLKNGFFSVYDRAEFDAALTWPQVRLTLDVALPEAAEEDDYYTYQILNLFGSLTLLEQSQSLSPGGLALSEMSTRGQAALAKSFRGQIRDLPGDQLGRAVLKMRMEEAPEYNVLRLILRVEAEGQSLLGKRCIIRLKEGKLGLPSMLAPP